MEAQFDYNTQRNKISMSEYGRNVQKMIEYTATIEDNEKRDRMALAIVDLMGQMNPHLRNVEEFKHKLWDHIYIISDGKLDVTSPYPKPDLVELKKKPEPLGYPKQKIRFKHYGKNVEHLIEKAKTFEDPEKKKAFTECIGNYMKLVYQNWNKEGTNDLTIIKDMETLSGGELVLDQDSNLDTLARSSRNKKRRPPSKNYNGRDKRRNKKRY